MKLARLSTVTFAIALSEAGLPFIPICAWCKRVRDNQFEWHIIDINQWHHREFEITHTICADCAQQLFGDKMSDLQGS